MSPLRSRAVPGVTRAGLRAGLVTSLHIPIGVLVVEVVPGLWTAYPLLVLPLLLAGPLAVRGLRPLKALRAAAVAGTVSGTVASLTLALAWQVLGDWFWTMNAAAGAPPMPPLPRITVLPTSWLTWAHQDILFFQPVLAVVLGLLACLARPVGRWLGPIADRLLPHSFGGRLRLAFGVLIMLTLTVGMVAFGMIEEMHLRTHRVQLRADWQKQLGMVRALLDQELSLQIAGAAAADPAAAVTRAEQIEQIYQMLCSPAPRPGVSGSRDDVLAVLEIYRPGLDEAIAAHKAFRAIAQDASNDRDAAMAALVDSIAAHGRLQRLVDGEVVDVLAGSDLTHHQRLIVVMALVGLVAGLGIWTGEQVLTAVGGPLAALGTHVKRVAGGDFSQRVVPGGPDEIRHLGESVNQMTEDLACLYDVERERRAMAEAVATREHELSAAKELWTNTLVHDLKSPLALIVGWSDLLDEMSREQASPAQSEAVHQIRQAARMLEDLVADVNDTFRLEAESLPINRVAVMPIDLLETAAREYRPLSRPAPEVQIAGSLGAVLADSRLVGRVLHNLIGNAHKHGGPNARVILVAETAEGAVRFAVDDDGAGIPPDERERVFERFIQGRGAQGQGAARGSGLGLAFCKLVVEQMGGRIWAETSPMGGTRIAFELPAATAGRPTRSGREDASRTVPRVA